jgi:glycerophosphoryl diester phosphodiesterase
MLIVAHRGFSAAAPENTLAAFQKAIDLHAEFIECDVRATADRQLVVIHDATLDRTTNGDGAVCGDTVAELKHLDAGSWFAPEFAGERIPTLDEVLDLVKGKSKLIVELKEENLEDAAVDAISAHGMLAEVMIASFNEQAGFRLTELDPRVPFELIVYSPGPLGGNESVRLADQASSVDARILAVNYQAITPDLVESARAANVQLLAWTVNDEQTLRAMADLGVPMIATDDLRLSA